MGFRQRRLAVPRRTTAIDITDADLITLHTDRFDDLVQQLARTADEWLPLLVLIATGRLTDKHEIRIHISDGMDYLGSTRLQRTTRAISDVSVDILDRFS
jgi:hypothetical protein